MSDTVAYSTQIATDPTMDDCWLFDTTDHNNDDNAHVHNSNDAPSCICYGTGRFLRSVLIPILNESFGTSRNSSPVVCIQPRGTSFLSYMKERGATNGTYEVDVVQPDGSVTTELVSCRGVFSMTAVRDKMWPLFFPSACTATSSNIGGNTEQQGSTAPQPPPPPPVRVIGVGVTEAGLVSHTTQAMKDVYTLLQYLSQQQQDTSFTHKICVINTDNVPNNGALIQQHMRTIATAESPGNTEMVDFLQNYVVFCNSMVDRIVSARSDQDPNVPRTEPIPHKALVVLDEHHQLPPELYHLYHRESNRNCTSSAGEDTRKKFGWIIRTTTAEYQQDLHYKLCIANATHTAIAHTMALLSHPQTDLLSQATLTSVSESDPPTTTTTSHATVFMAYLEALVHDQIIPALTVGNDDQTVAANALLVWEDWRQRLLHGYFGLSTFFITQNGAAKGGIRLTPTVIPLLQYQQHGINHHNHHQTTSTSFSTKTGLSGTMVYAYAALLRWLTPVTNVKAPNDGNDTDCSNTVYTGWLDGFSRDNIVCNTDDTDTITYADNLRYNLKEGWYEFKCACPVAVDATATATKSVASWLTEYSTPPQQASIYIPIIRAYLLSPSGGNCGAVADLVEFDTFVAAIATIYARMVVGDGMIPVLQELLSTNDAHHLVDTNPIIYPYIQNGMPLQYRPNPIPDHSGLMQLPINATNSRNSTTCHSNFHERVLRATDAFDDVVVSEVASALVIDMHTHLLPPTHGALCLWGIDELLTYHYLVAEYFITAPTNVTPESFYIKPKHEQADLIWRALFVDRMPLSEATRGVVTTLSVLGLSELVHTRDLPSIRKFYDEYRSDGVPGAERFSNMIHDLSGVRYNIMTNIPFDMNEAQYWRPKPKIYSKNYRSALRIDPLLAGDKEVIANILRSSGYEPTIDGACQYLKDWCDIMKPEYVMASTPHNFDGTRSFDIGTNMEAMKVPGAFAEVVGSLGTKDCSGSDADYPSIIDEHSDFLSDVLMKVCEERDLPIALKIGAHRGLNHRLKQAGDGVVTFADTSMLSRLCIRFPRVRFLATFLSRNNQHEACVLASKFSNLHLYGCWWYCFTPSIVKEITQMRVEMLGTAFTAQHSDARVLDQLLYKWGHSRSAIAIVVSTEFKKLLLSGWQPSRLELRREIRRMFGGSYEEFMTKSFL